MFRFLPALILLGGLLCTGIGIVACYNPNDPGPYFPNDPTCPKGGPLCPCEPGDLLCAKRRAARLDGGADARRD